jgi:hypothetical protein
MNEGELLQRIAGTLKRDIAPTVGAEYPRTQAHMAAVVLAKLGAQLALAPAHAAQRAQDLYALCQDLRALGISAQAAMATTFAALESAPGNATLSDLVAALYAHRAALGDAAFTALLARVRRTLRADIDRRQEFAA